jgi:hypothetical protein
VCVVCVYYMCMYELLACMYVYILSMYMYVYMYVYVSIYM